MPVHVFSDIVEAAYSGVMQDIIHVYSKKPTIQQQDFSELNWQYVNNIHNNQFSKKLYSKLNSANQAILNLLLKTKQEEPVSIFDKLFQDFYTIILYNNSFDESLFEKLQKEILALHDKNIKNLICEKLKAVNYYFCGNITSCISKLSEIADDFKDKPEIPKWLYNNVALDLRNMINLLGQIDGKPYMKNKGQEILNSSQEFVCFPVLDQIQHLFEQKIIKKYTEANLQSPYTINIGDIDSLLIESINYFCIALIYGSITHLRICRTNMIEILQSLKLENDIKDLDFSLVKFLLMEGDNKNLTALLRTFNRNSYIISPIEINKLITTIDYLPTKYNKANSKLLLLKLFGYFMSDEQFSILSTWFVEFSYSWAKNENRSFKFYNDIKQVYINCSKRLNITIITDFIFLLFDTNICNLQDLACELISYVAIKEMSYIQQTTLSAKLEKLVSNKDLQQNTHTLQFALIVFGLNTTIDNSRLENSIKNKMSVFYNNTYCLEIYNRDKKLLLDRIYELVNDIKMRVEVQGKNGTYIGFGTNPFKTITNILMINKLDLSWEELNPIIDALYQFLLSKSQSCMEKRYALILLTKLRLTHSSYDELNGKIIEIISHKDDIMQVNHFDIFDNNSTFMLALAIDFISLLVEQTSSFDILASIAEITYMDNLDIIDCLTYLLSVLTATNFANIPNEIVSSILQLCISLLGNKERDIKLLTTQCLIELTRSQYQDIALKQLSRNMDSGCSDIKLEIINQMKNIDCQSEIKEYIIQKAIVDNHYLVRKSAEFLKNKGANN